MAWVDHHDVPTGSEDSRYAVTDHDSAFAGRQEVADGRTPLAILIQGEAHERLATNRAMEAGVERIVGALLEALESGDELDVVELREVVLEAIGGEIQTTRLNTVRGMLRYFWSGGLNPWEAMKKLLAATREAAAELIGGCTQTEVALVLGETKAATSAREKQVEELLKRWGVKGYRMVGGKKTEEAREAYRLVQMGNKSRRKGERRKRAEALRAAGPIGGEG